MVNSGNGRGGRARQDIICQRVDIYSHEGRRGAAGFSFPVFFFSREEYERCCSGTMFDMVVDVASPVEFTPIKELYSRVAAPSSMKLVYRVAQN